MLRSEWEGCRACNLGEYRDASGGHMVFGEGQPGGVMFIGEGPGKDEAAQGVPFIGKSGNLLRDTIKLLGLNRYYISNTVLCRSCAQDFDTEGNPMFWTRRGVQEPRISDRAPTPAQVKACRPRLVEEIYLVDPKVIVALGQQAASAIADKSVSISGESGKPIQISIPGAGFNPVLTPKKQEWIRKVRGQIVMPTEQNEVKYLMVPVLHPAFILRRSMDARIGNPVAMFVDGMKKAVSIYARHMFEVYGEEVVWNDITDEAIQEKVNTD